MNTFAIPSSLVEEGVTDPRWLNSVFLGLKRLKAKQSGSRCEKIVKYILESHGHQVSKASSTEHDFRIGEERYEVKGSTTTQYTEDKYSFLQIRPDQSYDWMLFATFCYDGVITLYRIPKSDILDLIEAGVFKKQHGGNKANSRTFSYNGPTDRFENYVWYKGSVEVTAE